MGLVATLFMLADISVAQGRFFLGIGYAPISGEDKFTYSDSYSYTGTFSDTESETFSDDSTTDVAADDVSFALGVRMLFPEQDIEADFSFHRIQMTAKNTKTTKYNRSSASSISGITTTDTITNTSSDTYKYDITESGATNGVGANFRSTRAEGIHAQGGLEYFAGSSGTVEKNTSYVSAYNGTTENGRILPDDRSSIGHSRLVLSLGPVFVPAASSLQHGLLLTRILEDLETNDPPEEGKRGTYTVKRESVTNMIGYTFRTLGEGNAYFGKIGFGLSEYVSVERKTGNSDVANNTTIEAKGDGSLFLLTGGTLINDAHEISVEVQNSESSSSEDKSKWEQNRLAIGLAYRFLL